MEKNIGKNISKNSSCKYSQKLLDHAKKSATDALKSDPKTAIQKTAEATSDLIRNKIADKISETSPQENLGTATNWKKYFKKYISPQKKDRKLLMI